MKKSVLIIISAVVLASCGTNETKSKKESKETPETESKKEVTVDKNDQTVDEVKFSITGNDMMKFDKEEFKVKEGQKVSLTLKHIGEMKKEVMGHNWVLLAQGTDLAEFATKAMAAKDNNYIPEGDAVIVHTDLIGGGESTTITFDAPKKGTYDFICSFPGHYGLMKGKFIVE